MLIGVKPAAWRSEMASMLSGVAILPWEVTEEDLAILRNRNLPFLIIGDSDLAGPRIVMGQREAARTLTEKLLREGHRSPRHSQRSGCGTRWHRNDAALTTR